MVVLIFPDRNIRRQNRIEKRKQEKENKRHKKFSSKIGNCQARPISEINLPISRIYERAIKFLLLLIIIMRKFFMLLSELRGYPNSILHIIIHIIIIYRIYYRIGANKRSLLIRAPCQYFI